MLFLCYGGLSVNSVINIESWTAVTQGLLPSSHNEMSDRWCTYIPTLMQGTCIVNTSGSCMTVEHVLLPSSHDWMGGTWCKYIPTLMKWTCIVNNSGSWCTYIPTLLQGTCIVNNSGSCMTVEHGLLPFSHEWVVVDVHTYPLSYKEHMRGIK